MCYSYSYTLSFFDWPIDELNNTKHDKHHALAVDNVSKVETVRVNVQLQELLSLGLPPIAAVRHNDNMTEKNLKDINNELDELSIRVLELMNEHIVCKTNLERAVRSGCMDLAKTRYIQGTTQVSAMNIPTEDLIATKTVLSLTTEEGRHVFELKNETLNESTVDKSKKNKHDPLKWFGILVPSNLRQGQAWFSKAIDLSVQSANISADIVLSAEKFEKLLSTKKSLQINETQD